MMTIMMSIGVDVGVLAQLVVHVVDVVRGKRLL